MRWNYVRYIGHEWNTDLIWNSIRCDQFLEQFSSQLEALQVCFLLLLVHPEGQDKVFYEAYDLQRIRLCLLPISQMHNCNLRIELNAVLLQRDEAIT